MKRFPALVGLLWLLTLAACSPVFYAPNVPNTPLLKEKGDLRVSGHAGGGDEVKNMYQANLAWSFSKSLGVYGSIYRGSGSSTNSTDHTTTSGNGHLFDFAAGYHHGLFADRLGVEVLAGMQYGSGENNYRDAYRVNYSIRKPFGQVNVGRRGRIFEAVFSQRFSHLTYTKIVEDFEQHPMARPDTVADLIAASSSPSFLYEPSISLRIGRDPLKFTFDLSGTHNHTHPQLRMDHSALALGFLYSFKLR